MAEILIIHSYAKKSHRPFSLSLSRVCVCACCLCVRLRERERERKSEGEEERVRYFFDEILSTQTFSVKQNVIREEFR